MRAIFVAAIAGLVSAAAQAQVREVMVIHQNQQGVVEFKEPFGSASVGDPTRVDLLPKSDRIIVLQGKLPGLTDVLTFVDGHVQRHITVVVQPEPLAGEAGRVVLMHNQKNLSEVDAYICNPTCARVPRGGSPGELPRGDPGFGTPGGGPIAPPGQSGLLVPPGGGYGPPH